jgi:formate hydrogenlyase subunit 4
MTALLLAALQTALVLLLAPVFSTFIKKVHARLQGRQGPPLLQGYYDLVKLLRKDRIYSHRSSLITRIAPVISLAVVCTAGLLLPVLTCVVPFHFAGDFLFFIYLFALPRFLTALTGLDAGSTFGGMASSREMTLSSIAEPALLLSLVVVATSTRTLDLSVMTQRLLDTPEKLYSPFFILSALAFCIVILAENGRVPFDNPTTHLELTMVHEGMVLELSGRDLALFSWAHAARLLVLVLAAISVFFPYGIAAGAGPGDLLASLGYLLLKLFLTGLVIAWIETSTAKYRLFRVPDLLTLAFVFSLIALVALYMTGGAHAG